MKKQLALFVFILAAFFTKGQIAERPSPQRLYNNLSKEFPQFLSANESAMLEEKLEQFSNETSNQICVVIVDDLNGYEAMDYATRLGNDWGAGKKGSNNGIIVLIKPTKTDGGRDLAIAVGYGLEGAIPDLATKRVRDEQMLPEMKNGNYYAALDKGTGVLMQLAKGEINVKDYTRQRVGREGGGKTGVLIVIIVLVLLYFIFKGGGGRGYNINRGGGGIFWGGGFGGGGFGGGGSWGGGGSSSGGGWGGFGGGGFGGGGSSGKW